MTLRIVMETPAANPVARPAMLQVEDKGRTKSKF